MLVEVETVVMRPTSPCPFYCLAMQLVSICVPFPIPWALPPMQNQPEKDKVEILKSDIYDIRSLLG